MTFKILVHYLFSAFLLQHVDGLIWKSFIRNCKTQLFSSSEQSGSATIESYSFRDWNLTYRYKDLSKHYEKTKAGHCSLTQPIGGNDPTKTTVLLIHPVGIGLNSWFWSKLMDIWQNDDNQAFNLIAPDLIGCGLSNGGDAWDPSRHPLSFPLGWVQGIEPLLPTCTKSSQCVVVVQGGLAPVGVLLAARNPNVVTNLVLCSPPTYQDMIAPVPEDELDRNYRFLTNPWTANPAFWILEQPWALRFFSNAFLFANPCDDEWIQQAQWGTRTADGTPSTLVRNPVAAFNAGFCQHRSFEEELTTLSQPTLILSGEKDKRSRQGFVDAMKDCAWAQLSKCCNVLPWEDPVHVYRAISEFVKS